MDKTKKKLKILKQFKEVSDEKLLVESNINSIVDKVANMVDKIVNNSDVKARDLVIVHKSVTEVLKKFTDINSELELILEESFSQFYDCQLTNNNFQILLSKSENISMSNITPDNLETITQTNVELSDGVEAEPKMDISKQQLGKEMPQKTFSIENDEIKSDKCDIQLLRKSLKGFSAKIETIAEQIPTENIKTDFSADRDVPEKDFSLEMENFVFKPLVQNNDYINPSQNSESYIHEQNNQLQTKGVKFSGQDNGDNDNIYLSQNNESNISEQNNQFQTTAVDFSEQDNVGNDHINLSQNSQSCSSEQNNQCQTKAVEFYNQDNKENNYIYPSQNNESYISEQNNQFETKAVEFSVEDNNDLNSSENNKSNAAIQNDNIPPLENSETYISEQNNLFQNKAVETSTPTAEQPPSALAKLNSYEIKKENNSEIKILEDIILKPASHVVPTVLKENINQGITLKPSRSSILNHVKQINQSDFKMKKKKNDVKHLELKTKDPPEIGQECFISDIKTPSEFYITLVDDDSKNIDIMTDQINEYYSNIDEIYDSREEALKTIGKFGIAYIDKYLSWYRVEILDTLEEQDNSVPLSEDENQVYVCLVDYGRKVFVSYENLRKLVPQFCQIPKLALRCFFPLLYPAGSTLNKLTEWTEEAIEGFKNIINEGMYYEEYLIIVDVFPVAQALGIDLVPTNDRTSSTLVEMIVEMGYAVYLQEEFLEQLQESNEVYLPIINGETLYGYCEREYVEPDTISEAIIGYDPKDEMRVCPFAINGEKCYKGDNCNMEHIILPKDGITTDKEIVYTDAMLLPSWPQENSTVKILITSYIDACRFMAQIVNYHRIERTVTGRKYMVDVQMFNLNKEMNSEKVIKTYERYKIAPAIGEIVLAKYCFAWARATVCEIEMIDILSSAKVKVTFVDLGETTIVPFSDIRKIKNSFLKIPFQSIEFYLENYTMNDKCDPRKADQFFQNNLHFRNFLATIRSPEPPLKVCLMSLNETKNVGETIAELGYAVKSNLDHNVSDKCQLRLS